MNRISTVLGRVRSLYREDAHLEGLLGEDVAKPSFINTDPINTLNEARLRIAAAERLINAQRKRISQLESLALTDELTGLFNRRGLMAILQRELSAARRDKGAGGILIMCDLDNFKQINDRHGHLAGDAYLQTVATVLAAEVRPSDVVARIGGDEFAILLTHIDNSTGLTRAALLEKSFREKFAMWDGHKLPLRASFGLTVYSGNDAPETLLASADLKLYAHKARAEGI